MALNTRIQTRRDTASNWETKNPVLLDGEMIIVTTNAGDTRFKIGDGTKTYTQLPFQDESLYNVLSGKADSADLDAKQDALTGTEGQVVGFDESGHAVAMDIIQSDWSINDESKPAYVKNRTHYTETYEQFNAKVSLEVDESRQYITSENPFKTGNVYVIRAYDSTGKTVEVSVELQYYYHSDAMVELYYFYSWSGNVNNEAGFSLCFAEGQWEVWFDDTVWTPCVHFDIGESEVVEEVVKLDEKYIPDSITSHLTDINNPHNVTAEQIGAATNTDLSAVQSELANKSDADHTHDQYLTEVPGEYVTEDELSAKSYATTSALSELQTEVDGKADSDHTHSNVTPITTAGDGAAYTATVPDITALTAGVSFTMIPHTASTSQTATLNVNGLGAKALRRPLSANNTTTVAPSTTNWLYASKPVRVMYNGTYWIVMDMPRPNAPDIYGTVAIANGGTGANTAAAALTNLGLSTETWTFTLEDGSTVTKAVYVG